MNLYRWTINDTWTGSANLSHTRATLKLLTLKSNNLSIVGLICHEIHLTWKEPFCHRFNGRQELFPAVVSLWPIVDVTWPWTGLRTIVCWNLSMAVDGSSWAGTKSCQSKDHEAKSFFLSRSNKYRWEERHHFTIHIIIIITITISRFL